MKLHHLDIQAFGPFATQQSIHFSDLGENPLFLIDGATGAGKSSILHAVCYALYGETTDADRKELGLRCDHAEPDVLTELSLEFSIRGEKYRITRVPTQMRPAKRGGGETEQLASAHLRRVLEDGEEQTLVAKKKRDADSHIVDIIGLNPEQFLQVMVLPQGKFRELLLAKSDDRQVILSTLFQTEIYKRIEQLLKDKAGAIESQNNAFEKRKAEALADIALNDNEALASSITEAAEIVVLKDNEKQQAAAKQQQAATALKTAENKAALFANRDTKQQNLEEKLQQAEEVNGHKASLQSAAKALSIVPQWQAVQENLKAITSHQAEIKQAKKKCNNALERVNQAVALRQKADIAYQQRDPLKASEVELTGYQEKQAIYASLHKASSSSERKYADAIQQQTSLEQAHTAMTLALEKLDLDIDGLTEAVANKAELAERRLYAEGHYKQRSELESERTECSHLEKNYQQAKLNFEKAEATYLQVEEKANRIEMQWFTNQAAVLAAKLQEQQACSVCGSLEHPNPATFTEDTAEINQDVVDAAKQDSDNCLESRHRLKSVMDTAFNTLNNKQQAIDKQVVELAELAEKSLQEMHDIYLALEKSLKAVTAKERKLAKLKQGKVDKQAESAPLAEALKVLIATLPDLSTAKTKAKTELENADKGLPEAYRTAKAIQQGLAKIKQQIEAIEKQASDVNQEQSKASAEQAASDASLSTLNNQLVTLKEDSQALAEQWADALANSEFATEQAFTAAQLELKAAEKLQQLVKNYEADIASLNGELKSLSEQLKDQQLPDLSELQEQLKALKEYFSSTEEAWNTASQTQGKLLDTQAKIKQIEKDQEAIKARYEIVGTLAKAATGKGNVKVSLERFVLGNLLDQVLSIASQRLHNMSKGQYRLIRQNEAEQKRNTNVGLDLAIDDAYTGKTRPVATLSGGESFMASLALALGLSDVVQERSGGIQLDTLFIDEGFGSLDQESLQLAINTLIDLQATGRTIGIISHVSELKEQMSQRVEVRGSRSGSTIKLCV